MNEAAIKDLEHLRAIMVEEIGAVFDSLIEKHKRNEDVLDSREWRTLRAVKEAILKGGAK